ncbi:MAG: hypothetical protein SFV51_14505 [Bryobacteraceae bacterium]|nr:hypothetical protein [Bryobacteraceae bacterium]
MARTLLFPSEHKYADNRRGIVVPVLLSTGYMEIELFATVDTGAERCAFERRHGELLGLDVEMGRPQRMETATGGFDTFEHLLTIETFDIRCESTVLFASDEGFSGNVIGRRGWLDRVQLGLIDYEQCLVIGPYDGGFPLH